MKRILSTHNYDQFPEWAARVDVIDRRSMSRVQLFRHIVGRAGDYDGMILNGSIGMRERYVDLLAALTIRRTRRRPPAIVLTDCAWKVEESWLENTAMRTGIRMLDGPRMRFCVLSSSEVRNLPTSWGVDADRVVFTPYANKVTEAEHRLGTSTDGGVFAGGNSLRDYPTLLEAVRGLDARVEILTSIMDDRKERLPPNVAVGPIRSHEQYIDGLRQAAVVVTPLEGNAQRSAGVDTYLSAMAFGKFVIVSESPAARDYIEPGRTGVIVPAGDPAAMREAIAWALSPANAAEVAAIGSRAAEAAWGRFSFETYVNTLLKTVDSVLA